MVICSNLLIDLVFVESVTNQPMDGRTDGRAYGRTDGRTDRPAYRDARTHLKSGNFDKTLNYLSSGRQNTPKKGLYESSFELSYQGHVICFYRR